MRKLKLISLYLVLLMAAGIAAAAALAWHWANDPVVLEGERADYVVESGNRPRMIAQIMNKAGIRVDENAFVAMARLTGRDKFIKAGAYEAARGDSPWELLERMANGEMTQVRITLVEGWTYKRIRQALREDSKLKQTLTDVSDAEILRRLGVAETSPEGLFYPDTYVFVPGSSDFDILRRAHHAQQQLIAQVWAGRDPGLPLTTPYQALILASIIEKETGDSLDRRRVAGVFVNRLRMNMPLQTDPTVIYGMGEAYDGQIRRKDLSADTPWNTYTRAGLPPTPIASAGRAALQAALHPEDHDYLYFVARGDGTSEFSRTLVAHNRAVGKYILRQRN